MTVRSVVTGTRLRLMSDGVVLARGGSGDGEGAPGEERWRYFNAADDAMTFTAHSDGELLLNAANPSGLTCSAGAPPASTLFFLVEPAAEASAIAALRRALPAADAAWREAEAAAQRAERASAEAAAQRAERA